MNNQENPYMESRAYSTDQDEDDAVSEEEISPRKKLNRKYEDSIPRPACYFDCGDAEDESCATLKKKKTLCWRCFPETAT